MLGQGGSPGQLAREIRSVEGPEWAAPSPVRQFRLMLLKPVCVQEPPGELVKMQVLFQKVWGGI